MFSTFRVISTRWDGCIPCPHGDALGYKSDRLAAHYRHLGLLPGRVCRSICIVLIYSDDPNARPRWVVDLRFRDSMTGKPRAPFTIDVEDLVSIPLIMDRGLPDLLNRELLERFIMGEIGSFLDRL